MEVTVWTILNGFGTECRRRDTPSINFTGEEADDVLGTTGISAANQAKYTEVVKSFDEFYKVWTNVIYERARFNRRSQQEGEPVEQYITWLVETSEYGVHHEYS